MDNAVIARPRVAPWRAERRHEAAVPQQAAQQRRAAAARHATPREAPSAVRARRGARDT